MPMRTRVVTSPGQLYGRVMHGITEYTAQRAINVAALTANEVDADGWLKPGVPFDVNGALIGVGVAVFGISIEPIRVANSNSAPDLTAAGAAVQVALATIGQVNRKICEDNLGRVFTANEIAGFAIAGSGLKLLA